MEPSFQGQLARVEVPDLLTFVHLGRRTGVTELEKSDQSTRLFFRRGDPVYATSNKLGLRLGDLLVRMGRITRKDMDRCLGRRTGGHHIGQTLVAEGLLKEEELSACLKVQISEVIFDTFEWVQGTFAFYDDVAPPPDAVTLKMDIQNLLMEGVRRMDEKGRLAEVFPDADAIVEVLGNPERLRDNVTFTPEEWRVLFLIDGRRSLSEICQLAGNPDELATLEILNRLLNGNVIGFASLQQPSPETPAETAPEGTMLHRVLEPTPATAPAEVPAEAAVKAGAPALPRDRGDAGMVVSRQAVNYTSQTIALYARLVLQREGEALSFPLSRETHTLGRSSKNDIVIADRMISTFHARVDCTKDGYTLVDLKSTNGTTVNGRRITSAVLKQGDEIQVGPVKLRYAED